MKRDKIAMLQWQKNDESSNSNSKVGDDTISDFNDFYNLSSNEYDEDGWEYATSFERLKDPDRPPRGIKRRSDRVRRRTFYREFVQKEKEWTPMEVEEEMKKAYLILRSDRRLLDNVKKVIGSDNDTLSVRQNYAAFTQDIEEFIGEMERGIELCGYFSYTSSQSSNGPSSNSNSTTATTTKIYNAANIPSSMWQLKHKIESEVKKLNEGIQEIQTKMDEFPLPSRLSSVSSDRSLERGLTDEGKRVERISQKNSTAGKSRSSSTNSPKTRSGKSSKANPLINLEVKSESSKAIQTWSLQNELLKQKILGERKDSVSSRDSESSDRSSTSSRSSIGSSSSSTEAVLTNMKTKGNDDQPKVRFQEYNSNKYDNTYTYDHNNNNNDDALDATLVHSQQQLESRLILEEEEEQVDWRILEEREEVNREIFKNATRLRESMMLMAQYVNEQEELVEEVAKNVDEAYERVNSGVRQLEEAHEMQKTTPCTLM